MITSIQTKARMRAVRELLGHDTMIEINNTDRPIDEIYQFVKGTRGSGKTVLAQTWLTHWLDHLSVERGKVRAVVAVKNNVLAELFKRALIGQIPLANVDFVEPQRDEFALRGRRYDLAVLEDIDIWPLVYVDPNDLQNTARYSVLFDAILAQTHGPVLFTYTDGTAPLVQQVPVTTSVISRGWNLQ